MVIENNAHLPLGHANSDEDKETKNSYYVADPAELPSYLRAESEQFDAEFVAEITAKIKAN